MSLKILLDPILTARPEQCSTAIQFYTFVERVLAKRQDVYFYWPVPVWVTDQEMDWYPTHPNIKYIRIPQHKDRVYEYLRITDDLDWLLAFNGGFWDWDVLLTVRTGMIPAMRMLSLSTRDRMMSYTKEVWLIENMPLMEFKSSVATLNDEHQDAFTLAGYEAADRVMLMSYHEKKGIMRAARELYSPSTVLRLQDKIKEVVPIQSMTQHLKTKKQRFQKGQGKFCLAYSGRLGKHGNNLEKIWAIMAKHWIIKGDDKIDLMVMSVSKATKLPPPEFVNLVSLPREEFWKTVKNKTHVMILMVEESGFLLSLMEPIFMGTPVIVLRRPCVEGQLGPDYPFYVKSELEAYSMAQVFYDDYDAMYAMFRKWHTDWLQPTYEYRLENDYLYSVLEGYIAEYEARLLDRFQTHDSMLSLQGNEIVNALADNYPDDGRLFPLIKDLARQGVLSSLADKVKKDDDRYYRATSFSTSWNMFRLGLKGYFEFEDAGVETGHLRRK